jgi:RNA polymerase sigma-70 factor (ECF subfamily)
MDSDLLGSFIDRYASRLELYARQWCDEPEVVVQEAFVKLAAQGVLPLGPVAWFFRAARNGAINAGIARRRRRKYEAEAAAETPAWFQAAPSSSDHAAVDPESVQAALEALPGEQREMIVGHLWGGLTFEQLAELTGTSASSAHRLYHAGLMAVRGRLGRHVSPGPSVIQALVGIAIDFTMVRNMEDLIQIPAAPNLYWSLADRPRPFIDM